MSTALKFACLSLLSLHASAQISTTPVLARGETVVEGNIGTTPVRFRLSLPVTIAPIPPITVNYRTEDGTARAGTDYTAVQGTITLSQGPGATVTVDVAGDTDVEADENFRLVITNAAAPLGSPPIAVAGASISNDDGVLLPPSPIGVFIRSESVREGNSGLTPLRFTLTRSNPQSTDELRFNYNTLSDTATAGTDFEAAQGQVVLPAGQASASITINVIGDTTIEPIEQFKLLVAHPILALAPQVAIANIFDDDGAPPPPPRPNEAFAFDAVGVEPPTGETEVRLALRLLQPATEAIAFDFAAEPGATATSGADFTGPATGTLNFAAGDIMKQITFIVKADALVEPREFVRYKFTPPAGWQMQRDIATLSISDRPQVPVTGLPNAVIIACRPFVPESEDSVRLIIKRVGQTDSPLAIKYKTVDGTALAGSDYANTSGDLSWIAGNAELKRIDVPFLDDNAVEPPERFAVQLTDAAGANLPGRSVTKIVILDSMDQVFLENFSELCTDDTQTELDPNAVN